MAKRPNSPAVRGFGGIRGFSGIWLSSRDGRRRDGGCEEMGKVDNSVEDRVQTTTSATET